jgi:hypothetical protein
MINRLSELADFLNDESLPLWLKQMLKEKQQEIAVALEQGQSFTLPPGPNGEKVSIHPKAVRAVA